MKMPLDLTASHRKARRCERITTVYYDVNVIDVRMTKVKVNPIMSFCCRKGILMALRSSRRTKRSRQALWCPPKVRVYPQFCGLNRKFIQFELVLFSFWLVECSAKCSAIRITIARCELDVYYFLHMLSAQFVS